MGASGIASCCFSVTVRLLRAPPQQAQQAQQARHEGAGVTDVTDNKVGGACLAHNPGIASYRATTSKKHAEKEDEWARLPAIRQMLAETVQPAKGHVKRKSMQGRPGAA